MIAEALRSRLAAALDPRAEVLEAYLFGSQATGSAQLHSDIDVAVFVDASRCPTGGTFGYEADLTAALMAALGESRVDLVVLNRAPPLLYHRVLRDGIRILARDLRATTTREGYALSRYCDFVPQLAKIDAARRGTGAREPVEEADRGAPHIALNRPA
ncbi:MAG: nucleotidyltransferase domain-containing protein [Lautropia sp.]